MKGDLALDTVVSWIILLVVAMVVIGIIFHFSEQAKQTLTTDSEKHLETEYFESDLFSESQIKTYLQLCWAKTGENFNKDFICYILKGDMSSVDPANLEGEYEGYRVIAEEFNTSIPIATIMFEDVGNKVIIKN